MERYIIVDLKIKLSMTSVVEIMSNARGEQCCSLVNSRSRHRGLVICRLSFRGAQVSESRFMDWPSIPSKRPFDPECHALLPG